METRTDPLQQVVNQFSVYKLLPYPFFALQRTQLTVSHLQQLIPPKNEGINSNNPLIHWCVHYSEKDYGVGRFRPKWRSIWDQ